MELLAPAGNFATALFAFEAGADAVYLGLKQFSARKKADNFTFEELRRLKFYALTHNKKIFVTLNTLITDQEMTELAKTLSLLEQIKIDAVIIQDLGLLSFIKANFPSLEIHASTQMAIHSVEGAKEAYHLGISRAVLSRECSFSIIERIRREVPQLQIEVFIHGALCYSFSGLCLASGLMLERSGNRGECAQICRTYFERPNHEQFYPFSCNDLGLGGEITKLQSIGVKSYKIEGRMKSSEYVYSTVAYYRALLDGGNRETSLKLLERSQVSFARKLSLGYFQHPSGDDLINAKYPGHMGIEVGKMVMARGELALEAFSRLSIFDTLAFFRDGELVSRCQLKKASLFGKRIDHVLPNQRISFLIPEEVKEGDSVYLVGRSEASAAAVDYKRYPLYKIPQVVEVKFLNNEIEFSSSAMTISFPVVWQERKGDKNLIQALQEQFDRSGDSLYHLKLHLLEESSDSADLFLPPSSLKEMRRSVYIRYEECHDNNELSLICPSLSFCSKFFPHSRQQFFLKDGMPFVQDSEDMQLDKLAKWNDFFVLPLCPIGFDDEVFYRSFEEMLGNIADNKLLIGLNNISHLRLVDKFKDDERISFFIDYGLYLANSWSLHFVASRVPRLLFAYSWCESQHPLEGCVLMNDAKKLPLFISKGCVLKARGQKCSSCTKVHREEIYNGKRHFEIVVKRCLTYLFFK